MRGVLSVLLLSGACAGTTYPDNPIVVLRYDGELRIEYLDGACAWEPLGFRVYLADEPEAADAGGQIAPECGPRWYQHGSRDCQITIDIVVDPLLLERSGTDAAAFSATRVVLLDDRLLEADTGPASRYLRTAVAHEVGHVVLDTGRHTQGGIMGGATSVMRDVDYELACETIGTCL